MFDFSNLASFDPHAPITRMKPTDLVTPDDMRIVLDKIADEIWTFSLPTSELPEENRIHALNWSNLIRSDIPMCCATHSMRSLSDILDQIVAVLKTCNMTGCDETHNHDFLELMGKTIDRNMVKFIRAKSIHAYVERSKN